MSDFDRKDFNHFIIENSVVGFFEKPITLKSGRKSYWYVNWRTISKDVFLMDRLVDYLISYVDDNNFKPDAFYGVPEGASKLGILATYKWAKRSPDFAPGKFSLPMGRANPKQHGDLKDRYFVGAPEGEIIILEDVTTTGGSLIREIDRLKEAGVSIQAAIGLTNRMEVTDDGKSVEEAVLEKGVKYYSLSDATSFLPEAFTKFKPSKEVAEFVEKEFEDFGVKKIKLL